MPSWSKRTIWALSMCGLACLISCATDPSKASTATANTFIKNARKLALQTYPNLDPPSKATIEKTDPKFAYYRLAGNYVQYSIDWDITSNRVVHVWGQGDETLAGASIGLIQNQKKPQK